MRMIRILYMTLESGECFVSRGSELPTALVFVYVLSGVTDQEHLSGCDNLGTPSSIKLAALQAESSLLSQDVRWRRLKGAAAFVRKPTT
mgnify:CR=1 FL=1